MLSDTGRQVVEAPEETTNKTHGYVFLDERLCSILSLECPVLSRAVRYRMGIETVRYA
jgi:hypothetical protein